MTVLAGWSSLLTRYSQQDEVIIGCPVSGRNRTELDPVVGLLINTLPLRIGVDGDPTFTELPSEHVPHGVHLQLSIRSV